MKIDNFMLTMAQTCPAKYELRRQGWTSRHRSAALGFGAAIHEGLAEWYRSGNLAQATAQIKAKWPDNTPVDDYRSLNKCLEVMEAYARKYSAEPFSVVGAAEGNAAIEIPFTLYTGKHLDCLCGHSWVEGLTQCPSCKIDFEPIEYGGIFDGLIEFGTQVYILEHKTTSQLGAYYFNQFKPNNQVTGYVWAGGLLSGKRVGGAMINAIGVYKASATKFERHLTTRSQGEIDFWLENVRAECNIIKHYERTGFFPQRTGACTLYGACEYRNVHVLPSAKEQLRLLEQDFIREEWDFERRD